MKHNKHKQKISSNSEACLHNRKWTSYMYERKQQCSSEPENLSHITTETSTLLETFRHVWRESLKSLQYSLSVLACVPADWLGYDSFLIKQRLITVMPFNAHLLSKVYELQLKLQHSITNTSYLNGINENNLEIKDSFWSQKFEYENCIFRFYCDLSTHCLFCVFKVFLVCLHMFALYFCVCTLCYL